MAPEPAAYRTMSRTGPLGSGPHRTGRSPPRTQPRNRDSEPCPPDCPTHSRRNAWSPRPLGVETIEPVERPGPVGVGALSAGGGHQPAAFELLTTLDPLLDGHRVADVVLPHAVDLEVAHGHALLAEAELLDDPAARPCSAG